MDRVTTLKDVNLTGRIVLRVFLLHRILPLKARPDPIWEYIGSGDQFVLADDHLSEESLTGLA